MLVRHLESCVSGKYSQRTWNMWGVWITIPRQIQNICLKEAGPHRSLDGFIVGNNFGIFTSNKCSLYSILNCMSPCLVHTEEECRCFWVFSTGTL